jgi:hypothetical protein
MNQKKLLVRLASLVIFIFLVNTLSYKFYWYSSMWWFDMFMHFLGGAWVALFVVWIFKYQAIDNSKIFKITLGVLTVAISWEIFEFLVDGNLAKDGISVLDSISDVFLGLAGGLTAIFYSMKRLMNVTLDKV